MTKKVIIFVLIFLIVVNTVYWLYTTIRVFGFSVDKYADIDDYYRVAELEREKEKLPGAWGIKGSGVRKYYLHLYKFSKEEKEEYERIEEEIKRIHERISRREYRREGSFTSRLVRVFQIGNRETIPIIILTITDIVLITISFMIILLYKKKSENNLLDKKGLSKTVISLITTIVILVTGIGILTNYYFASQAMIEKYKSIYINLMNKNAELMNENVELTEELSETRLKLKKTSNDLATAKSKLEEATFGLGEDMLTLPKQSLKYDCDDSALYMYLYFTNLGYDDVQILTGNLDLDKETFWQCNHVWVQVHGFPYDWGYYSFDNQHYYGYEISYRELLKEALRDK